ncbi:MAG: hypothetical protein II999_09630 [Bacteroidaceae bacterium]|nr:hypothetical protein [Bacteroidaceae bacterium]
MVNIKFLQKLFILLFMGVSMCALQACSEDEDDKIDEPDTEETDNNETYSKFFRTWYMTGYSSEPDINWQSDEIVSWGEYMIFKGNTSFNGYGYLYWNSRMNGEDLTYSLSKIEKNVIGSSFFAARMTDTYTSDSRIFVVKNMTEKHLLLYDESEGLYRGFISSDYVNLSDGNESDNSGDDDNNDNSENEEDIKTEECGHCHGSGECSGSNCNNGRCTRCGGTGYKYYPGVGGSTIKTSCSWCNYGKCMVCRGRAICPTCNGKGYWVIN